MVRRDDHAPCSSRSASPTTASRGRGGGRGRSGSGRRAPPPSLPSPAIRPACGGSRRGPGRARSSSTSACRTSGRGPLGMRRGAAAEVEAGDVVGEHGVPSPGLSTAPASRCADGWRACAQPPSPRRAHRGHHLEQRVEVDPMAAGEHEHGSSRCRRPSSETRRAAGGSRRARRGPARPGRGGSAISADDRISSDSGTSGTAASVSPSGSAPSPGSSRPCSASSRNARSRIRRLGRRVGDLQVGQQAARHGAQVVGPAARAGEVQRVDEHGAVRDGRPPRRRRRRRRACRR